MVIEIIKHTPLWVWPVFVALVAYGWYQSLGRTVRRSRIALFPLAMITLSCSAVISTFGYSPLGIGCWLLGSMSAIVLGLLLAPSRQTDTAVNGLVFIPGSWLPMVVLMGIFFMKYAVAICLARQLPIIDAPAFIGSVGFGYGLLGGVFLARTLISCRQRFTSSGGKND